MTGHTGGGLRAGGDIDRNRCRMVVAVGVEVGGMALGAGAAHPSIDRGIAMAIDAYPAAAVGRIMAGGARGVGRGGPVASVASDAGSGGQHCCRVVVLVIVKIQGVAFAARMAMAIAGVERENVGGVRSIDWRLQGWWRGMAVSTFVLVDHHRAVGNMADGDTGRVIENDAEAGCRVIDRTMGRWRLLVPVTGEAGHGCLVGVVDHILNSLSRYCCVPGQACFVVAHAAVVGMGA